ncbi:hypothetical protein UlMin_019353 [Ulmus minor]
MYIIFIFITCNTNTYGNDLRFDLKSNQLYLDAQIELSSASLEIVDAENGATEVFFGNLSPDVTEGIKWNISRGGFCGMQSKKFDGFIDLDLFDTIVIKLKGDGKCYISTIYTENWVNSLGQEEENSCLFSLMIFLITRAQYLPTWRGNVIDAQLKMNPS